MKHLANNIRVLRECNNETQEQLSAALASGKSSVQRWETGRVTPSLDYVVAISTRYGVNINDLINKQAAYELTWRDGYGASS